MKCQLCKKPISSAEWMEVQLLYANHKFDVPVCAVCAADIDDGFNEYELSLEMEALISKMAEFTTHWGLGKFAECVVESMNRSAKK